MTYHKQLYKQIALEYQNRIDAKKTELENRKREAYKKIPRIREIDGELYHTGLKLTKEVIKKSSNIDKVIKNLKSRNLDLNAEKGELLSVNGFPVDYLTIKYDCKACKDTGHINATMCKCFKQRLIKAAYAQSNLSVLLEKQNFDTFDFSYYSSEINKKEGMSPKENIQNILNICLDFVNHFEEAGGNMLLYGEIGLGKTFLSSCIAKELLDQGKTVFYQTAYKILNILEDYKFHRSSDPTITEQADKLFEVDLLIIDDLGTEYINTYTSSAFFDILNTRILNNKKIIINTNLNINEIADLYTERVVSRLFGHFTQLKFFGEDIRKQKMLKEA
jgi:DNA replication protein DnaC